MVVNDDRFRISKWRKLILFLIFERHKKETIFSVCRKKLRVELLKFQELWPAVSAIDIGIRREKCNNNILIWNDVETKNVSLKKTFRRLLCAYLSIKWKVGTNFYTRAIIIIEYQPVTYNTPYIYIYYYKRTTSCAHNPLAALCPTFCKITGTPYNVINSPARIQTHTHWQKFPIAQK